MFSISVADDALSGLLFTPSPHSFKGFFFFKRNVLAEKIQNLRGFEIWMIKEKLSRCGPIR